MVDITIIGAGLSGLYAAKEAAINGANVIVHEKRAKLGSHLKCGELFTNIYGMPPEDCILNAIDTLEIIHNTLGTLTINIPKNAMVMTDRAKHESIIYEQCLELGVTFNFNSDFDDWIYTSDIINATGFHNTCPNHNMDYAVAMCYTIDTKGADRFDNNKAVLIASDDLQGYYWWFPKGIDQANIGGGYHTFNATSKLPCDFESVCNAIGSDDSIITVEKPLLSGGGKIPFNIDYRNAKYRIPNEITVGDSAGLVNPLLMGGEHLAVLSGKLGGRIMSDSKLSMSAPKYQIQNKYKHALIDIIAPEMELGIYLTKMRDILTPKEYWEFIKSMTGATNNFFETQVLDITRARMSKYFEIPESTDAELEQLIERPTLK